MTLQRRPTFVRPTILITTLLVFVVLTIHPALASGIDGSNPYQTYLSAIEAFLTGPYAKFVAAAAIIAGVIVYVTHQGSQLNASAMNVFSITAITVGGIIALVPHISTLVKPVSGLATTGAGSNWPSLSSAIGDIVGPIVSTAVPVIGALVIVGGLYTYSKSEHHIGLRHLGETAVLVGALAIGAGFLKASGSGLGI